MYEYIQKEEFYYDSNKGTHNYQMVTLVRGQSPTTSGYRGYRFIDTTIESTTLYDILPIYLNASTWKVCTVKPGFCQSTGGKPALRHNSLKNSSLPGICSQTWGKYTALLLPR